MPRLFNFFSHFFFFRLDYFFFFLLLFVRCLELRASSFSIFLFQIRI